MSRAKNLLVHKGGFSTLGCLVFSGNNLYASELLESRNHKEFTKYINTKIIMV